MPINSSWDNRGDIIIGNDVWIGHEAAIMAGVKIGDGARIATRAVVTKNVKPYEVVGGVPAKSIKLRFDSETIEMLENLKWWDMGIESIRANLHILMNNNKDALKSLMADGSRL